MSDKRFFLYVWMGLLAGVVIVLAGAFGIYMLSTALVPVAEDAALFFASLSFVNQLFVAGGVAFLVCGGISAYITRKVRIDLEKKEQEPRVATTSDLSETDPMADTGILNGGSDDE